MARLRFDRGLRLLDAADFNRVFDAGCKSADPLLVVMARANRRNVPRLGLAISKKNLRRAVDRNRIKRLVRESFRQGQEALAGLDVVVIARAGIRQHGNAAISLSLQRHWDRVISKCKES